MPPEQPLEEKKEKDSRAARMLAEPRFGLATLAGALIGLPGASCLTAPGTPELS